jgi:hypothetical protein
VLDWFLQLTRQVGEMLLRCAKAFMALATGLEPKVFARLSAVALSLFPPGFGVEFEPDLLSIRTEAAKAIERFVDAMYSEFGTPYFAAPA